MSLAHENQKGMMSSMDRPMDRLKANNNEVFLFAIQ